MLKWRERLVFLSLGISGALFSFAFSAEQPNSAIASRRLALYLVTPLASAIGWLWLVNAQRIYRIGVYIRDVLRPKINVILASYLTGEPIAAFQAFDWEASTQRIMHKWSRRVLEWVVLLAAFVLTGLVAQLLIVGEQGGSLRQRLGHVERPVFFYVNWLALGVTLGLFINHLAVGRKHRASSGTPQP